MPTLLLLALLSQTPTAAITAMPPREDPDLIRVERVPLEILGGAAAGLLAGAAGALVLCSGGGCSGDENFGAIAYFLLTAPLGISAGTSLVGYLLDGNGSYLASTGGVALGCLLDVALVSAAHHDLGMAIDVGMIALPILGGVLGYELTSDAHRSAVKKLELAPMVAPGAHGAVGLALSGQF
jgi:hypothetical protein